MDGSYGNVFPTSRAMSPSATAPAPSGNQYKVNVNRQKTKKWANFKPQNYDGDDWGDDYDEPAHEPNPPPPPKPMGPRQPAAYPPTADTARPSQPIGSPPLRTQTQQYVRASARPGQTPALPGPPSMDSGPPRRATEPYGSSPHNSPGHAQPPLPPNATRASPSPRSAHQLPSQLPPQKSSIDPSDAMEALETRSASPRSAGSVVSPTKPLPFIRPADVYQRMEQERAKERQPLEIGQSSADTGGVRHVESAAPEMQTQRNRQPESVGSPTREDSNTSRPLQPISGLAPVPERQSEYGIEGFLASYSGDGGGAEAPTSHEQMESAEPQKSVPPLSLENIRRFSTSPQLPDLTRMSGFGEDLFSSSFFPASGLRSPLSGSMQLSMSGEEMPDSSKSTAAGADASGQSAQSMTSNITKDADLTSQEEISRPVSGVGGGADASSLPPNEPDRDQSVGLSSHEAAAQPIHNVAEQQTPAEDAARGPASLNENQPAALTARPHLPGGWVSETPSTPGAELAVAPVTGPARETPDKASEAEGRPDTDAQPGIAPLNASGSQQAFPEAGVANESGGVENDPISAPLDSATPHSLSPLGRSSPTLSTKLDMSPEQAPPEVADRKASSPLEICAAGPSSPTPASATTEQSEITPTAPLNPRRGTPDANTSAPPVVAPPPILTEPTLDAEAHSPVKDSDKLSEEIIKSLSPMQTSGGFTDNTEGSTAAYHAAAADPTRESSYLGDVYGDYWTATEDKADPALFTLDRTMDAEKAGRAPSSVPVKSPEGDATVRSDMVRSSSPGTPAHAAPANVPNSQPGNAAEAEGSPKRFSWEPLPEGSAPATVSPPTTALTPTTGLSRATEQLDEQKALGSGAENVAPPMVELPGSAKTEPSQPSLGSEAKKSADDLRAESAPEVRPGATLAAGPVPDRPIQPSPVSDLTDTQSGGKQLSLAEGKIVLPQSPSPFTPPPLKQHPVFAENQRPQRDELPSAPSPKNVLGFRNIMEMPLPSERIKHYNETRWQFSAMDTGLDEWLRVMMSKHPEHANAVWSIQGAAPQTQQGGQGATQTHHGVGQSLRSPAHLHMPHQLQQGLSGLGHSSGQVGTKSKELLMAAGKAGKGLFSKGRNKLRGTGG